jgi:hypothetical protein
MSAMDRIGQLVLTDFVHGQMKSRRWDLSLALVDGQGFRIMPTKAMYRPIVAIPNDTNAE